MKEEKRETVYEQTIKGRFRMNKKIKKAHDQARKQGADTVEIMHLDKCVTITGVKTGYSFAPRENVKLTKYEMMELISGAQSNGTMASLGGGVMGDLTSYTNKVLNEYFPTQSKLDQRMEDIKRKK